MSAFPGTSPPLLTLPSPPVVLVASDLHLSEGRDPETGMYTAKENFLAAEAFRRWLAFHEEEATRGALLVLNGDTFDFVRINKVPDCAEDCAAWADRLPPELKHRAAEPVQPRERRFGLQTDAHKAVWKLHVAIVGHPEFFEGLAGWVRAGGRVVLVKGNHDLELHWDLVVDTLCAELDRRGAGGAREKVLVAPDGLRVANLIIEHGHVYEAMTAVEGPITVGDGNQLNLPLGSFVNRYFINPLERLDPFLDNLKPSTQALLALLRRRPLKIISTYWRAWRFLWRAIRVNKRIAAFGPVFIVGAGLFLPPLTLAVIGANAIWPQLFAWIPKGVRLPGSILGLSFPVVLPYLLGIARDFLRQLGFLKPTRHLVEGGKKRVAAARAAGDRSRRIYSVMGHTHEQEARRLPGTDFYVNTGTWIALWPVDRYDLVGRVLHSYARFTLEDGEYRHVSLVWDDSAGHPRPAPLLAMD